MSNSAFTRSVRSVLALTAVTATAIALSACSGGAGGEASGGGDDNTISIAYSVDVLDETQNAVLDAMKARVEEINAEGDITVTLDVYDAQSSVDKQISDIDSALIKQPDVMIISAVDPTGVLPAAQEVADAGVPIVDKRPSDPEPDVYDVAFFGNDESRYAPATADWVKSYLEANPDEVMNIGLIYGAPAQTAQLAREDVLKDLAEEMPGQVKIVAEGYGNWLTETAQNLTTDWLQAHPDINYISAANDIMALGAANALASAGRTEDVLVSGYDLTDDGIKRIQDGSQALDVGVSLEDQGTQVIDVALGLVDGSFTDKTYYVNPVYSVTADNVDDYLAGNLSK